jgi:hypothetical protein
MNVNNFIEFLSNTFHRSNITKTKFFMKMNTGFRFPSNTRDKSSPESRGQSFTISTLLANRPTSRNQYTHSPNNGGRMCVVTASLHRGV